MIRASTFLMCWLATISFIGLMSMAGQSQRDLKKYRITIDGKPIIVEVANTPQSLRKGLMFRNSLPLNQGMLFIFKEETKRSFWMKNTYIPLSIGFFDRDCRLVDIKKMDPPSLIEKVPKSYISDHPAQYALEMNQGWFEKNNVQEGDRFLFINGQCTDVPPVAAMHLDSDKEK